MMKRGRPVGPGRTENLVCASQTLPCGWITFQVVKSGIAMALTLVFVLTSRAESHPVGFGGASATDWVVTNSFPATNEITFDQFLKEVAQANLDYAAQRYNVSIAEASVAAAKVFPNPTLGLTGGFDVTQSGSERLPSTAGAALTQTLELGGKRKYRILGARQSYAATAATLDGFLRNLKLDAAGAFADALALARSAEQKRQSAEYLRRLAETQRARLRAGDISQADLLQTQVEQQQFQNEVLAAQGDAEKAAEALAGFLGRNRGQTVLIPKGSLETTNRQFDVSRLLADALRTRPDLVALRHTRDAAQSKFHEEKANRIPNVDVGAAVTHSTDSENSIAPSPEFNSLGLTLSLPIPLWNRNEAAIATARYAAEQAHTQLQAAELKTEVQLRQAFTSYQSAVERVGNYQSGILKDADALLEAKRLSYQRGQSSLLELLDAQRTDNEVRSSHNSALADKAKALIELQRAAGIWDIQF